MPSFNDPYGSLQAEISAKEAQYQQSLRSGGTTSPLIPKGLRDRNPDSVESLIDQTLEGLIHQNTRLENIADRIQSVPQANLKAGVESAPGSIISKLQILLRQLNNQTILITRIEDNL